ncbi:5977_t:CDS:2, partial [Racocetra persica]
DMCMLPHPHTGEDIVTQLKSILAIFNITTKIICATTDSRSNVVLAIRLLNMHLSMQNHHFYSHFKKIGQSVGKVYTSMPMTIAAVMRHYSNLAYYRLSQEEDSDLQAVTQFLQPFYEITNILSGSTYVTLGLSALLMDNIIDVISSYIQDSSSPQFLKTAAIQMIEKLNQYMDHIYDKAAFMASILDSRIKLELMPVNMNTPENQDYF